MSRLTRLLLLVSCSTHALYCDVVRDCRIPGNTSALVSDALSACAARCAGGGGGTLFFAPHTTWQVASVDISNTSGLTLSFGDGALLQGSGNVSAYPVTQFFGARAPGAAAPGNNLCYRAVLFGRNVTDLLVTGPRSAAMDGNGSVWWPIRATLPYQAPKLFELVDATRVRVEGMSFTNSANWHVHIVFSHDIVFSRVAVLGSRVPGGTDGIDPHSVTNMLIEDSHIDVGDDAIAVTSGPHDLTGALMPTRNVTVRRCFLQSRNFAIGSATFANISDVVLEDSTIGDDEGSAAWAIKIKSHCPDGGVVSNITFQRLRLGAISANSYQQPKGGYALAIYATYGSSVCEGPPFAPTAIRNVSFIDIAGKSAVWAANAIVGVPHGSPVEGLLFRNVSFGNVSSPTPWLCTNVTGTRVEGLVHPPLPPACM